MEKKKYSTPIIELIVLDNEIALELQSAPPTGPDEAANYMPEIFKHTPFEKNMEV